ncbi:UNVERIFIED_CONTAM: hypothetical protein FKN15_068900 [Acipenser sinensis]
MAGLLTAYLDCIIQSVPLPEPVASELRLVSGTLLQISGFQGQALGRSLAGLVVARRQLCLSQARVPNADKSALLDVPISPGHTFEPAVEEVLQHSHRADVLVQTDMSVVRMSTAREDFLPPRLWWSTRRRRPSPRVAQDALLHIPTKIVVPGLHREDAPCLGASVPQSLSDSVLRRPLCLDTLCLGALSASVPQSLSDSVLRRPLFLDAPCLGASVPQSLSDSVLRRPLCLDTLCLGALSASEPQ